MRQPGRVGLCSISVAAAGPGVMLEAEMQKSEGRRRVRLVVDAGTVVGGDAICNVHMPSAPVSAITHIMIFVP